ncbi:MAG: hypothetical protein L6V87_07220 [Ruminococcus sp.]|nr:MAG: hypothetical protein L6V87_07220 [Ruminococcus sp.]
MKQIKKSDLNLIIAVIALLLTAAAISAAIVYVNRTPEVYPSDREAVYEAKADKGKGKVLCGICSCSGHKRQKRIYHAIRHF